MWRRFKKILCCKGRGGGEDAPPRAPATRGAARTPKSPDDNSGGALEKERALSWN